MWTSTTRPLHSRAGLRARNDLTAAEWMLIEPWMPTSPANSRPREMGDAGVHERRFLRVAQRRAQVANAEGSAALADRTLPVHSVRDTGMFETLNHGPVMIVRQLSRREAGPARWRD